MSNASTKKASTAARAAVLAGEPARSPAPIGSVRTELMRSSAAAWVRLLRRRPPLLVVTRTGVGNLTEAGARGHPSAQELPHGAFDPFVWVRGRPGPRGDQVQRLVTGWLLAVIKIGSEDVADDVAASVDTAIQSPGPRHRSPASAHR